MHKSPPVGLPAPNKNQPVKNIRIYTSLHWQTGGHVDVKPWGSLLNTSLEPQKLVWKSKHTSRWKVFPQFQSLKTVTQNSWVKYLQRKYVEIYYTCTYILNHKFKNIKWEGTQSRKNEMTADWMNKIKGEKQNHIRSKVKIIMCPRKYRFEWQFNMGFKGKQSKIAIDKERL